MFALEGTFRRLRPRPPGPLQPIAHVRPDMGMNRGFDIPTFSTSRSPLGGPRSTVPARLPDSPCFHRLQSEDSRQTAPAGNREGTREPQEIYRHLSVLN